MTTDEHEARITYHRRKLTNHTAGALAEIGEATRSLNALRSSDIYDVDLAEGTEGKDIAAYLADAARNLRAATALLTQAVPVPAGQPVATATCDMHPYPLPCPLCADPVLASILGPYLDAPEPTATDDCQRRQHGHCDACQHCGCHCPCHTTHPPKFPGLCGCECHA